jgi:ATP-dependent Clp protease protease subunit
MMQTMQKVVFIKQAVTEDVANNMIALTLYLDSRDNKRIYYWLNCPGGEVRGRPRGWCSSQEMHA